MGVIYVGGKAARDVPRRRGVGLATPGLCWPVCPKKVPKKACWCGLVLFVVLYRECRNVSPGASDCLLVKVTFEGPLIRPRRFAAQKGCEGKGRQRRLATNISRLPQYPGYYLSYTPPISRLPRRCKLSPGYPFGVVGR